jgi:hypothetical protein
VVEAQNPLGGQRVGVVGAQDPLQGGEDVSVLGLGRGVIPTRGQLPGDLVAGGQRGGVVGTQNPQPGGQYVAVLGLGRGVIAAGGGGSGDTVPGIQSVGVIRAQHALPSAPAATSPPTRCPPHDPHQPTALIIINLTRPQAICHPASLGDHHQPRQPPRQAHPQGKRDLLRH